MNWKMILKEIIKGIQIPYFSPIPLIESYYLEIEKKGEEKWKEKIEAFLAKIENDTLTALEKADDVLKVLALSQISKFEEFSNIKFENNATGWEQSIELSIDQVVDSLKNISPDKLNSFFVEFFNKSIVAIDELQQSIIRRTPLSQGLSLSLRRSLIWCKENDCPYQTPNIMLCLFEINGSLAMDAFNHLNCNLGSEYKARFEHYVMFKQKEKMKEEHFIEFDWYEKEWIQNAQEHAFAEGCSIVLEKHLLKGTLTSSSKTITAIREKLDGDFDKLIKYIDEAQTPKYILTDFSSF